jgi:hypothetical protein
MVNRSYSLTKTNAQYSSQCLTPIINHTAYSRYLPTRSKTRSFNGRKRTIIHVSIKSNKIKDTNTPGLHSVILLFHYFISLFFK